MRRKAASPIVLISAARTPPKDTTLRVNKLITIIAPPHPGITPNKEQIGTSNFLFCKKYKQITHAKHAHTTHTTSLTVTPTFLKGRQNVDKTCAYNDFSEDISEVLRKVLDTFFLQ